MLKVIKGKGRSYKSNNNYRKIVSAPEKSIALMKELDERLSFLSGDVDDFDEDELNDLQVYTSELVGKKKINDVPLTEFKRVNPKRDDIVYFYDNVHDKKMCYIDLTNLGQVKACKERLTAKYRIIKSRCEAMQPYLSYKPLDDPTWKEYEDDCIKRDSYKNFLDLLERHEKALEEELRLKREGPQEEDEQEENEEENEY